jgi:hypothetical protein
MSFVPEPFQKPARQQGPVGEVALPDGRASDKNHDFHTH